MGAIYDTDDVKQAIDRLQNLLTKSDCLAEWVTLDINFALLVLQDIQEEFLNEH